MRTSRLVATLALCATFAACGGSPSSPSTGGLLQGTWRGTLTTQEDGRAAIAGPTTWTFTDMPGGAGHSYTTDIQSQHAWFATTARANTGFVDGTFEADGSYASPRGCQGMFVSFGTADAHHVSANFHGADCDFRTFTGSVDLAR